MISIVIPLRNEDANVPILVVSLTWAWGPLGREYEVLFINDGSTDSAPLPAFMRLAPRILA